MEKDGRQAGSHAAANGRSGTTVAAVVVHHDALPDLERCLEALSRGRRRPDRTVVVDNSPSADVRRRAARVVERFGAVHVPMEGNVGFAAGCNRGAEEAMACDRLFFVNQDATVSPDCLAALIAGLDDDPQLAAINPLIVTQDGLVWFAGGRLHPPPARLTRPGFGRPLAHVEPSRVVGGPTEWVNGCALLVRAEAWQQLGGFDERYFLYWEDVDFSVRARSAGWRLRVEPTVEVVHHQGRGGDRLRTLTPVAVEHSIASRLRFIGAHSSGWRRVAGLAYTPVNAVRLLSLVARHRGSDLGAGVLAAARGVRRGLATTPDRGPDRAGRDLLFLDQTGALGGGELALLDVVRPYRDRCEVVLFDDGPFRERLEAEGVPVTVVRAGVGAVRRESGPARVLSTAPRLAALAARIAATARGRSLVYANSQKALLVGAVAATSARVPLVFHLHDILVEQHFSRLNRRLSVVAANRCCRRVIADSEATARAFVAAGGRSDLVEVVHYGFEPVPVDNVSDAVRASIRSQWGIDHDAFLVGHFGRLSPWKGQDVFLRALARCPDAVGMVVGAALFGEHEIEPGLRRLAADLGINDRVVFTGFQDDVLPLMAACDLTVHSSVAPEPFGRVIVESMLVGTPVVAAGVGGPLEIIDEGVTGWFTAPGDDVELSKRLGACRHQPAEVAQVGEAARRAATRRFSAAAMHDAIARIVSEVVGSEAFSAPVVGER